MRKEKIEAICTARDYIKELIEAVKVMSENMYSGNEKDGLNQMPLIIDGLEYICKIVKLTDNAFGKVENIEEMNGYFDEIVGAVEGADFILVGDLFSYEVTPILESIEKSFNEVLETETI